MPGIILHYIARKRWFEAAARAALADGARQVVVLGAGYDTLAWRLAAAHPEVRFLELDHPATQASKRRALGETQNFRLAAIDFAADSLGGALRAANFSSTQPTLFVAEGLLMYLSTARVAELLRELAEAAPGRARLAFSYLLRAAGGRIALARLPWAGLWLRWQGEPFLWAAEPARLADFLRGHGWAAGRPVDGSTLRAQLPVPSRFARGARAAGEQFMVAVAHP